jgi:hypothetical protein
MKIGLFSAFKSKYFHDSAFFGYQDTKLFSDLFSEDDFAEEKNYSCILKYSSILEFSKTFCWQVRSERPV